MVVLSLSRMVAVALAVLPRVAPPGLLKASAVSYTHLDVYKRQVDTAAAAREQERLTVFHQGLAGLTTTVRQQALQASSAMAAHQQQICSTLVQTAQAITTQAEAHARATLGEITQLVQAAAAAPRAAAEVIGELRHALSASLVRDNAVLEERRHLLGTLGGLLDAVNHASTEQRSAIDALVQTTAGVLDRVGARFAQSVEAESRTLQAVACLLYTSRCV